MKFIKLFLGCIVLFPIVLPYGLLYVIAEYTHNMLYVFLSACVLVPLTIYSLMNFKRLNRFLERFTFVHWVAHEEYTWPMARQFSADTRKNQGI